MILSETALLIMLAHVLTAAMDVSLLLPGR